MPTTARIPKNIHKADTATSPVLMLIALASSLMLASIACAQGTTAGGGGTAGGASGTMNPGNVTLISINVTAPQPTQNVGQTLGFRATGTLSSGPTIDLTKYANWASSNPAIAGLIVQQPSDSVQNVSCISAGAVSITATYGGLSGSTTLTCIAVLPPAPTPISLAIAPTNPTIPQGQPGGVQYKATETYSDGSTQDVTASAVWSSSNSAIVLKAALSTTQEFDCVGTGSATVSATNDSLTPATTTQTCSAVLSTITVTPASPSVVAGNTFQFIATCNFTDGSSQPCASPTWASGTTATATINQSGLATAAAAGTSTISATLGSTSGTTVLTVTAPGPPPPTLSSIQVTPSAKTVNVGQSITVTATGVYSDSSTQSVTAASTWTTSNSAVGALQLADAVVGQSYSQTLTGTGSTPYTWTTPSLASSGKIDILDFAAMPLPTRNTTHLTGPSLYKAFHVDGGLLWWIKNSAGNPWDGEAYDGQFFYHWFTEDGDSVDQAACIAAGYTSCFLDPFAYKMFVKPVPVAPRYFTLGGADVVVKSPGPNNFVRTTNCGTDNQPLINLGNIMGITHDAGNVAWGGSVGTVRTIEIQYYWGIADETTVPPQSGTRERYELAQGFGQVQWDTSSWNGSAWVVNQTSTQVTTASGGAPTPNFGCKVPAIPLSGGLPPGTVSTASPELNLHDSTGVIDGTPNTTGTYNFIVQQEDAGGAFHITPQTIIVNATAASATQTVKCASAGTVTITATDGSVSGNTSVTCQNPAPTLSSIAVAPSAPTQFNGSSTGFTATGTYSDGSTQNLTASAAWTSSNSAVATITSNIATCVANSGTSTITATTGAVSGTATLTCQPVSTGTTANAYCTSGGTWIGPTSDGPAALPTACINTALSNTPSPGTVTNVLAGQSLQNALLAAHCGDILKLQAGATFSGVVTLPAKSCDSGHWIQIRSSAADNTLPAESQRLTPCYAGVASLPGRPAYPCPSPTVVTAKILFTSSGSGPITFANGANYYRIGPGIEITRSAGTGSVFPLITNAGTADHIIIDRVWCHGTAQDETQRCQNVNGITYGAFIDSYISDIHCISVTGSCTDSQAISGGTSTTVDGPYKIYDDFIESSGEGTLWGGGSATAIPQNIEVRQNHYFKPLTWLKGQPGYVGGANGNPFVVKNNFELKNGQKVLVEGNIFENVWGGFSQVGYQVLLTPKNQAGSNGTNLCSICRVSDVTFRYNYAHHSGAGMSLANAPSDNGGIATEGDRYSIHDDVFDDISVSKYAGNGVLFQVFNQFNTTTGVLNSITINHITGFPDPGSTGKIMSLGNDTSNPAMYGLIFTNNMIGQNPYPIWSTGGTTNCAASDVPITALNACFPGGYTFNFNAMIAVNQANFPPSKWPTGNFFPSSVSTVLFNNFNGGNGGDYTLQASSPYHNAGSDGKDLGADIVTLNAKTAGVEPGASPSASANWQLISTPASATHINEFAVDGSNNWYLADRVSGFWKSTNQGASWSQINSGLVNTDGFGIQHDAVSGNLFASIYNPNYPTAGPVHFYVSSNGGATWAQITEPAGYVNSVVPARSIILSAGLSKTTVMGGLFGPASNTAMYSTNDNFNSTALTSQGTNSSVYDLFYNSVTSKFLQGTETNGLMQSSDGITWVGISPTSGSIRVGNAKGITYATDGTPLFTAQGGVWKCDQTTNCANPINVLGNANTSAGNGLYRDSYGSIYEGHNHDTANPITIYRSLDQGTSWQEWDTGIPTTFLDAAQFLENPVDGKIYAVLVDDSTNAGSVYSTPK